MKKIIIILIILASVLAAYLILPNINPTGRVVDSDFYAYSTAICDENKHCEDYFVECNGSILQKLTATGFSVQQNLDWKDSRNDTKLCN